MPLAGALVDWANAAGGHDNITAALARWKFRPATKNGNPVALETVVVIPFKPGRAAF